VFVSKVPRVRPLLPSSIITELPPEAQGGALVNLIHGYTDNGDPFIQTFTDQLLEEVLVFIWK
jgi:hypothetical protein